MGGVIVPFVDPAAVIREIVERDLDCAPSHAGRRTSSTRRPRFVRSIRDVRRGLRHRLLRQTAMWYAGEPYK